MKNDDWPSEDWFESLAAGEPSIVAEFWSIYGGPLHDVANRQLSQQLKRRVDPEDVVQSACRTFFRRVQQGQFELAGRSDLWRLLLTITLNKARMQARYHGRECRDVAREHTLEDESADTGSAVVQALEEVDFADFIASILKRLDDEQGEILRRVLDGQTQNEIATSLRCSQRTVRRVQTRIRELLEGILQRELQLPTSEPREES